MAFNDVIIEEPDVSPDVILLAEGLSVSDKAGTVLVEEHLALGALQAGRVPLQVGGHPQDVLVVYLAPAPHAERVLSAYVKINKDKRKTKFYFKY